MKTVGLLSFFLFLSCAKQPVHPPVGRILLQKDLQISKDRSKSLNDLERTQIKDWISQQNEKYYPMSYGYWVDNESLVHNFKRKDFEKISYQYEIYDFDKVKLSEKPIVKRNVYFGKFEELKAVENALRHMKTNDETTLLVPSGLAFGTYGDNNKIPNDMPLIIKLKVTL